MLLKVFSMCLFFLIVRGDSGSGSGGYSITPAIETHMLRMYTSFATRLGSNSVGFVCSAKGPPSLHFYKWNNGEYKVISNTYVISREERVVQAILRVSNSDCRNTGTFTCKFASNYDSISSIIKCPLMVIENYDSTIVPSASATSNAISTLKLISKTEQAPTSTTTSISEQAPTSTTTSISEQAPTSTTTSISGQAPTSVPATSVFNAATLVSIFTFMLYSFSVVLIICQNY